MSIKPEDIFRINQRIRVFVPGQSGLAEQYRSRVEDITPDSMEIAMPMSKGYPVMLQRGEIFFGRTVNNHVAYEFTSSLLARQINPLPVWKIAIPYNIKKIQQRAFVRIDLSIPVEIKAILEDGSSDETIISASTKDISGGGVQIVTSHLWEIGTKVMVTIHYPQIGPLTVKCDVVRIYQPQSDLAVFWVGLRFLEIAESDRGNIIKLIFKTQLEQRRKGVESRGGW